MGQQHSQRPSPQCLQVFRCWQSEQLQATPTKAQEEEQFLYDLSMKDLLISNKEQSKWTQEHSAVAPFPPSLHYPPHKHDRNTADTTDPQPAQQPIVESEMLLPEYSCKKQLFPSKQESLRSDSMDTAGQTLGNLAISEKENVNSLNRGGVEMSPKRESRVLSLVHARTPCSQTWRRYLGSMNKNKFIRSNRQEAQGEASSEAKSPLLMRFLNPHFIAQQGAVPNGYRQLMHGNGDIHYGYFEDGLCQGQGKYVRTDGTVYDGSFLNGQAHGFGIYTSPDGYRYEGEWKDNLPEGRGKVLYRDGSVYEGQLLRGKRHGAGCFSQNGCRYEGEFREDRLSGRATLVRAGGERYLGTWKDGLFEGEGEQCWPNGDRYTGGYKAGKRSGYGVMRYQNGDVYAGEWRNGMKDGQGTFTSGSTVRSGLWVRSQYLEDRREQ